MLPARGRAPGGGGGGSGGTIWFQSADSFDGVGSGIANINGGNGGTGGAGGVGSIRPRPMSQVTDKQLQDGVVTERRLLEPGRSLGVVGVGVMGKAILRGLLDSGSLTPDRIVALGLVHVPEGRRVFPELTIEENLRVGAYLVRDRARVRRERPLRIRPADRRSG